VDLRWSRSGPRVLAEFDGFLYNYFKGLFFSSVCSVAYVPSVFHNTLPSAYISAPRPLNYATPTATISSSR